MLCNLAAKGLMIVELDPNPLVFSKCQSADDAGHEGKEALRGLHLVGG